MPLERAADATLTCHCASPARWVRTLDVSARLEEPGMLRLIYLLEADLDRLKIPPPAAPARSDRLWEHTCFEAFVACDGDEGYREFNFSPSGAWAVYAFDGYRRNMKPADAAEPVIRVHRSADRLEIDASIQAERVHPEHLRLGLAAVIEDEDGVRSYWALSHPASKPDFHRAESRAFIFERANVQRLQERR
jgi:hypothetical protein